MRSTFVNTLTQLARKNDKVICVIGDTGFSVFEEFEKEQLQADIETFSYNNGIDTDIVIDIFTDYSFSGGVSDEAIRRRLMAYHFGLLKITKLTNDIRGFVVNTYNKYRAEGE